MTEYRGNENLRHPYSIDFSSIMEAIRDGFVCKIHFPNSTLLHTTDGSSV